LRAGGGEQQDERMRKRKGNVTKMKREIKAFGVFLLSCREGLGLATEDNGKEVEILSQFLQKLHIKGFKLKIANASLRRLFSGAAAGAVSRTAVAPLETIRTHLMVGNGHHSVMGVFDNVMKTEGLQGLFRGNGVNVLRVAPSKAIEVSCNFFHKVFPLSLRCRLCLGYHVGANSYGRLSLVACLLVSSFLHMIQ
jgi:hypothetical protein